MSAYANDQRVIRLGDDEFAVGTDSGYLWTVRRSGGGWAAFVGDDPEPFADAAGLGSADDVIRKLIGDPR